MLKFTLVGDITVCAVNQTVIKTIIANVASSTYFYYTATGSKRTTCLLGFVVVVGAILPSP